MEMRNFNYNNTEIKKHIGGKVVRKVTIKNGKGYKSITKYRKGKKVRTIKKPVCKSHIALIRLGKFIPGLFSDCKCGRKKHKTRKYVKGGTAIDNNVNSGVPARIQEILNRIEEVTRIMEENNGRMSILINREQDNIRNMLELLNTPMEDRDEREQHMLQQESNELYIEITDLRETSNRAEEEYLRLREEYENLIEENRDINPTT
jgi:hypothetical protein